MPRADLVAPNRPEPPLATTTASPLVFTSAAASPKPSPKTRLALDHLPSLDRRATRTPPDVPLEVKMSQAAVALPWPSNSTKPVPPPLERSPRMLRGGDHEALGRRTVAIGPENAIAVPRVSNATPFPPPVRILSGRLQAARAVGASAKKARTVPATTVRWLVIKCSTSAKRTVTRRCSDRRLTPVATGDAQRPARWTRNIGIQRPTVTAAPRGH